MKDVTIDWSSASANAMFPDGMIFEIVGKKRPLIYVQFPDDYLVGSTFEYGRYVCGINYEAKKGSYGWAAILGILPLDLIK